MTITASDMQSKLLTVEDWANIVAPTENLSPLSVPMDGTGGITVFSLPSGWNLGLKDADGQDLTDAKMGIGGGDEYALTKDAILAITTAVGIPTSYVLKTPGPMIQSHLNYWASHSPDVALKFLTKDHEARAVTKSGITPFSNLDLLDRALEKVHEKYGTEDSDLYVDFKSHHDLAVTSLRLIVPEESRLMESKRASGSEDRWSAGIQIRNSLTGKVPTSAQGYLFAWYCANGAITLHAEGKYNRKIMGQNVSDVLDWTGSAVNTVIESMEHEFDSVEALVSEGIEDSVSKVMADIFKTYKVPLKVRHPIMDALIEGDDFTYYGVMNAITQAANTEGLPEHFVTAIMEIGGDVAHSASARCGSCQRVLV